MQHMAAQTMMRFPGGVPGMMPQGRQFSSPNSAFSPVQGFYGKYCIKRLQLSCVRHKGIFEHIIKKTDSVSLQGLT